MSYSLSIVDGDLVQRGSQLGLVFGTEKLKQDVNLWLMEQYGSDRFHTNMGSILQDFIGGVVTDDTGAEVQAEIFRVLQNYQAVQLRKFRENPKNFSVSELLMSVDDVSVKVNFDTVNAIIRLRNGSNLSTTINLSQSV